MPANRRATFVSAIVFISSMISQPQATAPRFTIESINSLGGCCTTPEDINNKGQVVGASMTAQAHKRAFLWESGSILDLGVLSHDTQSTATGINEGGEVLCTSGHPFFDSSKIFIWKDDSARQMASPVPAGLTSAVSGRINDSGNYIGSFNAGEGGCRGFAYINDSLWTLRPDQLTIYIYTNCFAALDINNSNTLVGTAYSGSGSSCAWINVDGQASILGDTGGYFATCINDRGQVAGYVGITQSSYREHPCVWREAGVSRIDSFYTGYSYGQSYDVNESGWVVGYLYTDSQYAFLYVWDDDTLYDLNDLIPANSGWVLENAVALNDSGRIVGTGTFEGQAEQGFLLTPASTSVSPGFGRASPRPAEVPFRIRAHGGSIQVQYRLAQDADVQVLMLDSRGRTVHSTSIGRRSRGDHTELVRAPRGLQGVHIVRIAAGLERWDEKVILGGD